MFGPSLQYLGRALLLAAWDGRTEEVIALLDQGADIEATGDVVRHVMYCSNGFYITYTHDDSEWCAGCQWCRKCGGCGGNCPTPHPPPTLTHKPCCMYWTNVLHVLDWCMTMYKMYGL